MEQREILGAVRTISPTFYTTLNSTGFLRSLLLVVRITGYGLRVNIFAELPSKFQKKLKSVTPPVRICIQGT